MLRNYSCPQCRSSSITNISNDTDSNDLIRKSNENYIKGIVETIQLLQDGAIAAQKQEKERVVAHYIKVQKLENQKKKIEETRKSQE